MLLLAALAPWPAFAEPASDEPRPGETEHRHFGSRNDWALGLEDILSMRYEPLRIDDTTRGDNGDVVRTHHEENNVHAALNAPALTVDYFPLSRLSLGMAITYHSSSHTGESESDIIDDGVAMSSSNRFEYSSQALWATPRVGFALPVLDELAVWSRVGARLGFGHDERSGFNGQYEYSDASNAHTLGVTMSVLAVYSPLRYFTVFGGPGIEKRIVARYSTNGRATTEGDSNPPSVSASVGLGVRL